MKPVAKDTLHAKFFMLSYFFLSLIYGFCLICLDKFLSYNYTYGLAVFLFLPAFYAAYNYHERFYAIILVIGTVVSTAVNYFSSGWWGAFICTLFLFLVMNILSLEMIFRSNRKLRLSNQAAAETAEKFRLIAEYAPIGISLTNRNMQIEYISPRFIELFGYTYEDIPDKHRWFELAYPDRNYRETIRSAWNQFVYEKNERGISGTRKVTIQCKDGTGKTIQTNTVLLDGGKCLQIFEDITNRETYENTLKESLSILTSTMESTKDGVLVVNQDKKNTYYNSQFLRLWNLSSAFVETHNSEEVLRQVLDQLEEPEEFLQKVKELYYNPELSGHDVIWFKDGKVFERYTQPQRIENQIVGRVWNFTDITKRQRAEEERLKLETQLLQSQKMESIGKLAGGIAHDFNNILTVIIGTCELLLMKLDPNAPSYKGVVQIKNAGERASSLTSQLLAFSRKQILQLKVLDLNKLLENMDNMIRRIIGEDIDYQVIMNPDLGRIKADPGQIEQVVMNLAVNSRDAMLDGGSLTIETRNIILDDSFAFLHADVIPGNYVVLIISDTGCGIDKGILDKIFDPFYTTKEKGTGLGLSTVYGIIKQSNGYISVYSEINQGTTFKIYLPRVDEIPAEVTRETSSVSLYGTETILVVEDDDRVREFIVSALEKYGYTVFNIFDPNEAIQWIKQRPDVIDLLLTDVIMPQMSGRQLAENILLLQPDIQIIYMSGYTDNAIVHHGILEKGINFIPKPFKPDDLARKIRDVLDR